MSKGRVYNNRVLVIGPTPPPYHGVAVMTDHLVQALKQLGRCAGHLDTRDPQPLETIGRFNVTNVTLGLRHAWRLHRLLRHAAPVTVILPISQGRWGFLRDTALVVVIRIHRARLILHLHGAELDKFYDSSGPVLRKIIRSVFGCADAAWALTPGLERMFDRLMPTTRVAHIENVARLPPHVHAKPVEQDDSHQETTFRLLYLANLRPQKGVFDLLDALQLLAGDARGWRVRLVGAASADVIRRTQAMISTLNAKGSVKVELLPALYGKDKWAEYRNADAFVFPPRAPEGQPVVLLEAMAAGLPLITTRIGGIPDTVRDGVDGLLVSPGDIDGLAKALLLLSQNPALRAALAGRARERYDARYRPERLTQDLANIFDAPVRHTANWLTSSGTPKTPALEHGTPPAAVPARSGTTSG